MGEVEVGRGRSYTEWNPGGFRVVIPSHRTFLKTIMSLIAVITWPYGMVLAQGNMTDPVLGGLDPFMVMWLVAWAVMGPLLGLLLLWVLTGKEVINVSSNELQHVRKVPGLRWSREYRLTFVKDVRFVRQYYAHMHPGYTLEWWGLSGGSIAFDYGRSTHRFGAFLEEAEAKEIVDKINDRIGSR